MKKLEVDQPTIEQLLMGENKFFVIPVYQRPYAWEEEQCAELWHDLNYFAFPKGIADNFNPYDDFYYLGNTVAIKYENHVMQVVDGQQRIISLLLLMRALYTELHNTENGKQLGKCIWYFTEKAELDTATPRVESKAVLDWDRSRLKQILVSGNVQKSDTSHYAKNYRFFCDQIAKFKEKTPDNIETLAGRLLRNVYVTRMIADAEEQALQLFLTINDRGLGLRIEDIFKAKLYDEEKKVSDEQANAFLAKWQHLGERCERLFSPNCALSKIEFAYWLYAENLKNGLSWKHIKQFYSANDYTVLKSKKTLQGVNALISFIEGLNATSPQNDIPSSVARKAHTLLRINRNTAHHLFAFYLFNRQGKITFDDDTLDMFLDRCLAFLIAASVTGDSYGFSKQHGILEVVPDFLNGNTPANKQLAENIVRNNFKEFYELKSSDQARRIIIIWWAFLNENQPLLQWNSKYQLEHICPKAIAQQRAFGSRYSVELPGNLALIEASLNKKAGALSFTDKCKHYKNSKITELRQLAEENRPDFTEHDILARNQQMLEAVVAFLDRNNFLLK